MILQLFTSLLACCGALTGKVTYYNSGNSTRFQSYFVQEGMYQSQGDFTTMTEDYTDYDYYTQIQSTTYTKEYLIKKYTHIVSSDAHTGDFGSFNLNFTLSDSATSTLNLPDNYSLFELSYSYQDEDFGNNDVFIVSPHINETFMCNIEINVHNIFTWYRNSGNVDYSIETCYFDLSIPLYVKNDAQEQVNQLPYALENWYDSFFTGDYVQCDTIITMTYIDTDTISQYWYDSGYYQGKEDGYALGGGNDFSKILGTIIDTPILYLRKFFGYEVFGVNLYGAIATIMSLIVALAVFRMIRSFI